MHPVLFQLGSFKVHTYGVLLIIAFLVGLLISRKRAPKFGIDPNRLSDMAFITLVAGVLGARIAFLIQEPPADWHEYFSLQFAGLTSFGGLIGGAIVVIVWAKRHKIALRALLDTLGPAVLVGQAIGRVGCLLNGCCAGGICPVNYPFGVPVPGTSAPHYPAQMVDSLLCLAGFGLLLWGEKKIGFRSGQVFAVAIALYGLSRFIYEFWRAGTAAEVRDGIASSTYIGSLPLTEGHIAAAAMILLGVVLFFVYGRRPAVPVPAEAV